MQSLLLILIIQVVFGDHGSVDEGGTINIDCDSTINIISGNYICKSSNHASDKTSILAGLCNGQPSCSVGANNGVFGDPYPGCYKKFDWIYECAESITVDEGGTINIDCGADSINIESGYYICKNNDQASDKTSMLAGLCDGKNSCSVGANNGVFGDPYPGCGKKFTTEYDCVPGVTVDEGGTINIDCGADNINIIFGHYICTNTNQASDKTSILAGLCNDKPSCSVGANNNVFADPYPGCLKKFTAEYECIVDPCSGLDCSDGKYCTGEEYCHNGECFPGEEVTCPYNFICDENGQDCIRDCDVFDIDGFLGTCSEIHSENINAFDFVRAEIEKLDEEIDEKTGENFVKISNIEASMGEIDDKTGVNAEAISNIVDDIADIRKYIGSFRTQNGATFYDGVDPYAEGGAGSTDVVGTFWYNYKEELLFGMILVNTILIIMVGCMCYYMRMGKGRYERVSVYSSADEDKERVQLNK